MSGNYTNNWQIGAAGAIAGSGLNLQAASQNTISLSNLNSASGSIDFDWNHLTNGMNSNVKKYEVYEISQDLLALSVCWSRYRKVRNEPGIHPTITKLLDSELFRLVTDDDIAHANTIRDYYSKKIMVWKLKNINLTHYREDLNTFIHSNGKTFKEAMLPLAYRLPEFYEYDVEFEKMSFDYNKEVKRQESQFVTERKQLKFVTQLSVNTRRAKRKEYWFSDSANNLVTFSIEPSNPLISMLDMTLKNNDVTIAGRYKKTMRDDNEYLRIEKFNFV
jgi:hypothetical protein